MSIYATTFDLGMDHKDSCARISERGGITYQDDSKPCTCQSAPIVYQHSGVLPSDGDKRDGTLDLGAIPGHIAHGRRKAVSKNDNFTPYHPWLRVSVNQGTVVLDSKQVKRLRDELTRWLRNLPSLDTEGK